MGLQVIPVDFTQAQFLNGAYLGSDGKVKSFKNIILGTPALATPSTADGEFNSLWNKTGLIDSRNRIWVVDYVNKRLNYYDLQGNYLGKIVFYGNPRGIKEDVANNELFVVGDRNFDGNGNTAVVLDIDTFVVKKAFAPSSAAYPPDKTIGELYYVQDCELDDNYYYISDWSSGVVQRFLKDGTWDKLFYDEGADRGFKLDIINNRLYICDFSTNSHSKKYIDLATETVVDLTPTTNDFLTVNGSTGLNENNYHTWLISFINGRMFKINKIMHYTEEADLDGNFVKKWGNIFPHGHNPEWQDVLSPQELSQQIVDTMGIRIFANQDYLVWYFQTYAIIFNIHHDQTALWQNLSLGGSGTIKQINVNDNGKGEKKWFVKKSTDTDWVEFIPNKYYADGILSGSQIDLKVEMGNFFCEDKTQIEIEEIIILLDDGKPAQKVIPLF